MEQTGNKFVLIKVIKLKRYKRVQGSKVLEELDKFNKKL